MLEVTLKNIQTAREVIKDEIYRTPLLPSKSLNNPGNNQVFLKLENMQRAGSFKVRGAFNKLAHLTDEEKSKGVIASSAGNHAQGVALAASTYGIESTIVMPVDAPTSKIIATEGYGANVILSGESFDEAGDRARELQKETGVTFLHAFNDEHVVAGQGTVGLEILEDLEDVDAIVVPIGGGGLIAGIAVAAKTLKPEIKIIGVESENADSMKQSLQAGEVIRCAARKTIADGIAVNEPGHITYKIIQKYVDEIITVTEDEIKKAVFKLVEKEKLIVEGGGAVSMAAIMSGKLNIENSKIVAVISGGNIDMNLVKNIIDSTLIDTGHLAEIRVSIPNKPGHLKTLLEIIADTEANISTISQTNVKPYISLGDVEVTLGLETKGHEHVQEIHEVLLNKGYKMIIEN